MEKAVLLAEKAAMEREMARLAKKQVKYEQSLSKDVPVIVTGYGRGSVISYDPETERYSVRMNML
jgi:hypothetical protein